MKGREEGREEGRNEGRKGREGERTLFFESEVDQVFQMKPCDVHCILVV